VVTGDEVEPFRRLEEVRFCTEIDEFDVLLSGELCSTFRAVCHIGHVWIRWFEESTATSASPGCSTIAGGCCHSTTDRRTTVGTVGDVVPFGRFEKSDARIDILESEVSGRFER
jgi:hypothetical protein